MDCKRPHKYRTLKLLLFCLCILTVTSCTWVGDKEEDCPDGFWLRLCYTYNILDVEAVSKYVEDAYVYIYNADGEYVKRIYYTQEQLKSNNYRIRVDDLPVGDYQFVVWSGVGDSQYSITGDMRTMDDFRLSLTGAGSSVATELPALFYGYLPTVHYDVTYASYDVELMKNTNQLACLVVPVSNQVQIGTNDYTMKIVANNATMDVYNRVVSDVETTYEPFVKADVTFDDVEYGELSGAKFSMMTLRLMSDLDSRIILERKSTGEKVFDISFPEYIGMIGSLYTNLDRQIPIQEYLDRQDFYTIVFYLSAELDQLMELRVNNWRLRAINHLKL